MKSALPLVLLLAACATDAPAPSVVGTVKVGAESYPIVTADAGTWRVMVDGQPVTCAKPDADSCYWSVRHYLQSQQDPDVLG